MIPQSFAYERPTSLAAVIELLSDEGVDSVLLAGGHSLVPLLKLRMATPDRVVDLNGVPGLDGIDIIDGQLVIGGLATHASVATHPAVRDGWPLLAETGIGIGDAQVRDWGTIGGSCAHGHPSADWPAALMAAGADLRYAGADGERTISADEAFIAPFMTAIEPGEVLTAIEFPTPPADSGAAYRRLVRPSADYAVAGVGTQVALGDDGTIGSLRIGVTGASGAPFRATDAETAVMGKQPTEQTIEAAADAVAAASDPMEDMHGSAKYRRAMAAEMTRRALTAAIERAGGGGAGAKS